MFLVEDENLDQYIPSDASDPFLVNAEFRELVLLDMIVDENLMFKTDEFSHYLLTLGGHMLHIGRKGINGKFTTNS